MTMGVRILLNLESVLPYMITTPVSVRSFLGRARRFLAILAVAGLACSGPGNLTDAYGASLSLKLLSVKGVATNTITSLEFINDVTLRIEAQQVGYLTHFGGFTGEFSYLAVASPAAIVLTGTATLTNTDGEQLFLTASIVELGTAYPMTVVGTLTVTGGTGRFAGATGSIAVSGKDEESLSDTLKLAGTIITLH
jgi:hypothetical protein